MLAFLTRTSSSFRTCKRSLQVQKFLSKFMFLLALRFRFDKTNGIPWFLLPFSFHLQFCQRLIDKLQLHGCFFGGLQFNNPESMAKPCSVNA